jgi:hypothetical protein
MEGEDMRSYLLFVSYAHEDRKVVEGLRKPFIPLEHRYGCKLYWDDRDIRSGDNWRQNIEEVIAQAQIAVLLLSPNFFASEFIFKEELPRLLESQRAGRLTILPMLVGPIDLEESGLAEFQFVNPPEQPLKKLKPVDREKWYLNVAVRVKEILKKSPMVPEENLIVQTKDSRGSFGGAIELAWTALVPPEFAVTEIKYQLGRLKRYAKSRGFAVFERDGYYVQVAYYAELDDSLIIVEAKSNAYLPADRQLSKEQIHYLTEKLEFSQFSEEENLILCAPLGCNKNIEQLALITWHILNRVYNSDQRSLLTITAQCM